MRRANDHRGCLRALVGTKFGNLLDFDMGGRVGYSPEEEAGTSGEPGVVVGRREAQAGD